MVKEKSVYIKKQFLYFKNVYNTYSDSNNNKKKVMRITFLERSSQKGNTFDIPI